MPCTADTAHRAFGRSLSERGGSGISGRVAASRRWIISVPSRSIRRTSLGRAPRLPHQRIGNRDGAGNFPEAHPCSAVASPDSPRVSDAARRPEWVRLGRMRQGPCFHNGYIIMNWIHSQETRKVREQERCERLERWMEQVLARQFNGRALPLHGPPETRGRPGASRGARHAVRNPFLRSRGLPQMANRYGIQAIAEAHAGFAGMQHDAVGEAVARSARELAQSAKVSPG